MKRNFILLSLFVLPACTPEAAANFQRAAQQFQANEVQQMDSIDSNRHCMSNPVTGAYVQCYHMMADGTCAHYGPPCI